MKNSIPVIKVSLPQYRIDTEPDHKAIGKPIDDVLREYFMGQTVLIRGLGSMEHSGKSADDLIEIIMRDGTDRYDPERTGDRYANVQSKHIDLYALKRTISPRSKIFWQLSWSFYQSPLKTRGYPVKVDILVIYDPKKLKAVVHKPTGNPSVKRDGFVFREPNNKSDTVKAIIKILG